MKANDAKKVLWKYASKERKKSNEWFFKTGKGEYGEGDKFIGVRVPDIRKVARQFFDLSFFEIEKLLKSKIHEERLCAILILVENTKQIENKKKSKKFLNLKNQNKQQFIRQQKKIEQEQKKILKFYLKNLRYVNNWDLVDLSAHYILGEAILNRLENKKLLNKLVLSEVIWERRIVIVSTFASIRKDKISETLRLAKKLLGDKEDLMHKAAGWMLREAWKKDNQKVEKFLIKNYNKLSRTTLRYTIERMGERKRKRFLRGEFK